MANISDNALEGVLINPKLNGTGTHYVADCPFCNKAEHLYVQRKTDKKNERGENVSYMWNCKKCGEFGKLYKLLKKLDRLDLWSGKKQVFQSKKIDPLYSEKEDIDLESPRKSKPLGYKRIFNNKYLNSRGINDIDYKYWEFGIVNIERKWKDYIVVPIIEDGEWKGYLGRYSKDNPNKLRYMNSSNTDFAKLLYGFDRVTDLVDTVIICEGVFDVINVTQKLHLYDNDSMKCVCTFGKKISAYQIEKLRRTNIKNIVLLYDDDAISDMKRYIVKLDLYFNVYGTLPVKNKDAGDMTRKELMRVLEEAQDPLNFKMNKI